MKIETELPIACAAATADVLGEVPLWCERSHKLWWLDVRRPALQWLCPATGQHGATRLPSELGTVGAMALRQAGGFVLATGRGLFIHEPDSGRPPRCFADPEAGRPGMRMNDGKCDPGGRFWVGSMHDTLREPMGTFYRVDPDLSVHVMFQDFVLPNSVAWSPDGLTMYFADTHRQMVWQFDHEPRAGTLSHRRVFKDWRYQLGRPDGAAVDEHGFVWTCMLATGQLVRQRPDGELDRIIQLPVTNPTCPAFGGADLGTLFITTHSQRLSLQEHARQPLAGALLALQVGVKGLREPRFAG